MATLFCGMLLAVMALATVMQLNAYPPARLAVIFAMPQRRSIVRSRLIHRIGFTRRLVGQIWNAERSPDHDRGEIDLATFDAVAIENAALIKRAPSTVIPKRALDVVLSLALILFTLPVMMFSAIAIKLDSRGPVFYRQKRVGLNGKLFDVIKFRTMTVDAEKNGAMWAQVNDKRVTRVGAFLRRTRLDEVPQVLPILLGHMSFVGPRPERPEFTTLLAEEIPHYDVRHRVKPGLTGWAQVMLPYGASVEDAQRKLCFDLYYIRHFSLLLDLFIVIKTVRVALFSTGSR
ncbi:exopolysaccharide biosynthesis polyprenyl glycosylphosphotransferase [Parvularcula sp. LCG005]|uniref:exopolysaccharide biosynthesis polyprenyl glycosylphosphotransferase n=1 Tax=Parvularcula sp. LCG005 TaxID=3078805 RepID=UPI0029422237|nr:exopolysaccharide biosynthesis polyprenyl glycosylphosphotransferase [Parvularcula sp. LCG005]WOI52530.1 exopolysaccharide biosynthesis polyprenyl glycosylphosphotransferase [Parvularcula sp. LCG005]